MTAAFAMPRAVIVRDGRGPRLVRRSPGFGFDLEEPAFRTAVAFGDRPAGVACPPAVFAYPLGTTHVGVFRVSDESPNGTDPPLEFRVLAIDRRVYAGDPFAAAVLCDDDWHRAGTFTDLDARAIPVPPRTVERVREVLETGDPPLLLGAAQTLLDGGRIALDRTSPAADVRAVWELLPYRARCEFWPATFAFDNRLKFHLAAGPGLTGGLTEDQTRDYPEGRYELAVQTAAEAGDAADLDRLFNRKTSREVLRTAAMMVGFAVVAAVVLRLF